MAARPRSSIWLYYTENAQTPELADCNLCHAQIRRAVPGAPKKDYQTSSLWGHLKACHKSEHEIATEKRAEAGEKRKRLSEEAAARAQMYVMPTASKQPTLKELGENRLKYPPNHEAQQEGELLMGYWLCDALKPYTTVENEAFIKMVQHLNKRFTVPSEKVVRTSIIPQIGAKLQYSIKDSLNKDVTGIMYSLTTDMWTSGAYDGYISYTVHYITIDWKRKMVVLRCMPYSTKHTGESISVVLKNITQDWGLRSSIHVVVRDNASNVSLGVRMANLDSLGCYTHILHLINTHVINSQSGVKLMRTRLRNLVKKLKTKNGKCLFQKYQDQAGVPKNAMILSCETRWKSEYLMFERAEQQKQAIKLAEDDEDLNLPVTAKLTPNDWSLIPKVISLLKPLYHATLAAESDSSCVSDIIPLTKRIKIEIQRVTETGIGTLKSHIISEIGRYLDGNDGRRNKFPDIELHKVTAVATFLDPRYKVAGFKDKDKAQRANRIVLQELKGGNSTDTDVQDVTLTSENVNQDTVWEDVLMDPYDSRSDASQDEAEEEPCPHEKELQTYLKMPRVSVKSDPLEFWKKNERQLPGLAKLARRYLSAPASSSASEREFKVSKNIVSSRIRLLPMQVENLLFIKYNLRAMSYSTNLPKVPEGFVLPNRKTYELTVDEEGHDSEDEANDLYDDVVPDSENEDG